MFLLFDIGGTNTRVAVSRDHETVGAVRVVATPPVFGDGLRVLKGIADELCPEGGVTAVAGGLAGSLDRERTMLLNGENIADWVGRPVREELERIFRAHPVYLENDAAMACLGEAVYGVGKDKEIVAYLTVSTGVGGARVVRGRIDASAFGFEPGFQIIDAGSSWIPGWGGRRLRDFASGKGLEKAFRKNPAEITDGAVWEQVAEALAIGINNTIVYWSPDVIVVGGSVMASVPLERVSEKAREIRKEFPHSPAVVRSAMGDAAGLWGALARARQK
ncbi:MAG: ROK family protein [Patescibacteria group bacterium]